MSSAALPIVFLARHGETAWTLSGQHTGLTDLPLTAQGEAETAQHLREWNYGTYEGRTSADIHAERPDWQLFRDGCPGGESPDQIGARADRAMYFLLGTASLSAVGYEHARSEPVIRLWDELPVVRRTDPTTVRAHREEARR